MRQFFKNNGYIMWLCLMGILNWVLNITYLYSALMVIISFIIIIKNLSRRYFIPLLLGMLFAYRFQTLDIYHILCIVLVVGLIIFDIIRCHQIRKNHLIIGYMVWIASMIMSLFTAIDISLAFEGIGQAFVWFIILYYCWVNMNEDMRVYSYRSFAFFSLALALQIIVYFCLSIGQPMIEILRQFDLGWGDYSQVSLIYLISLIITTLWFIQNQKKWSLFILALFQLFMAGVFASKGSYIAMLLLAVPFMILVFQNVQNRHFLGKILIGYLIFALLFRLFVANPIGLRTVWYERVGLIDRLDKDVIFQLGIEAFRSNPLFGIGAYNSPIFLRTLSIDRGLSLMYFQNYWIQTLATLGLVGLGSFWFLGVG
ncbi:MAG: hypothetical protein WC182_04050, partial [Bacilli bacterium]